MVGRKKAAAPSKSEWRKTAEIVVATTVVAGLGTLLLEHETGFGKSIDRFIDRQTHNYTQPDTKNGLAPIDSLLLQTTDTAATEKAHVQAVQPTDIGNLVLFAHEQ